MRTRTVTLLGVVGLLGLAAPAAAQFGSYAGPPGAVYGPGGYGGPVAPGMGTSMPGRQTLSPYLNILAGTNNPAINYFNFARPALQAGGYYGPAAVAGGGLARQPFFPPGNLDELEDLAPMTPEEKEALRNRFPPTGHPAGFNNALGYFGGAAPGMGSFGPTGRRRTTGTGSGATGGTGGAPGGAAGGAAGRVPVPR